MVVKGYRIRISPPARGKIEPTGGKTFELAGVICYATRPGRRSAALPGTGARTCQGLRFTIRIARSAGEPF